MPRVVHFEIHVADPERAVAFYTKVFGWEITKWAGPMDYWLIKTGPDGQPGINGGMLRRHGEIDGQAIIAYVCTISVENCDASLAAALAAGGSLALAKMAVPSIGWLAYAKDTEGNVFGILQPDAAAK